MFLMNRNASTYMYMQVACVGVEVPLNIDR